MDDKRFEEPQGFHWGRFQNDAGAEIRYGHAKADGEARGVVVMVGGFREHAEKYFEVINEMKADGLDVWFMDWRGQGGSERCLKDEPQKAHHNGYEEQIETLHKFTQEVVKTNGKPLILSAHSMGAHLGLRYLKEHAGVFDSAIMTAPMVDILTGGMPKPLARKLAQFAKAGGYLEKFIPGGGPWTPGKEKFEVNELTSDPDRWQVQRTVFEEKPELQIGDPTYGWVYHTFRSIDILVQEDYLKSIDTPVLMEISGKDTVVDKNAAKRAADLMPNCQTVDIPDAKHEIWMERDDLRKLWTAEVRDFLDQRLKGVAVTPKKSNTHKPPRPPQPA
ncbi:MAG: alpha/beta hydrolase [Alphaproteobacteria bacterium]|nr:alpha/beta hydrolase [Alphaproteobacteria bacterium]